MMLRNKVLAARLAIASLSDGPFPVDVKRIAVEHGIATIEEDDLGRLDAFLIPTKNEDAYIAVVNSRHSRTRRRFSLAHEIGHVLLAEQETEAQFRRPSCDATARPVERACNQLAAEMLMPAKPFRRNAEAHDWRIEGGVALSQLFDTSLESTFRRYVELANGAIVLIKWALNSSNNPIHIVPPIASKNSVRIVGFDRRYDILRFPSLHQAYTQNGIWRGDVGFEILPRGYSFPVVRSYPTESMGYNQGGRRQVFSLVRINEGPINATGEPTRRGRR